MNIISESEMTDRQIELLGALMRESDLCRVRLGRPPGKNGSWKETELEISWQRIDNSGGQHLAQVLLPMSVVENNDLTIPDIVLRLRELASKAQIDLTPKKAT